MPPFLMPGRRIENVIQSIDGRPRRSVQPEDMRYLMMHRTMSHDLEWYEKHLVTPDAEGCAKFYQTNKDARSATGGQFPYGAVVGFSRAWQTRHLGDATPHARAFSDGRGNNEAFGIACIGDFRFLPPNEEQWFLAVDIVAAIVRRYPHLQIVGHDEVPGAAAPGKSCPGKFWDMNLFRADVQNVNVVAANRALVAIGMEIR